MTAPATAGLGTVSAVQGNIQERGTAGRRHGPEDFISCQRSMRVIMQEVCGCLAVRFGGDSKCGKTSAREQDFVVCW